MGSRAGLEVDEGILLPCHYSAVVQHVASSLYWSRYSDPHFKDHYYTGLKKTFLLGCLKLN
jgi:hypothetical protein